MSSFGSPKCYWSNSNEDNETFVINDGPVHIDIEVSMGSVNDYINKLIKKNVEQSTEKYCRKLFYNNINSHGNKISDDMIDVLKVWLNENRDDILDMVSKDLANRIIHSNKTSKNIADYIYEFFEKGDK